MITDESMSLYKLLNLNFNYSLPNTSPFKIFSLIFEVSKVGQLYLEKLE